MIEAETALGKPSLRGVLHQWAAVAATGAGLALVSMAPTGRAALGAALYAASLATLFTVSATYHRVHWSVPARARMRSLDHASIFLLIAGTYTPIALLAVHGEHGTRMLLTVWGGAVLGILQSVFWVKAPKVVTAALAIAVGWCLVPFFSEVRAALGGTRLLLLLAGGVAYTLGAVAYATRRPTLWRATFGYHEVFHALTLVGATFHFAVVVLLVRDAWH